MNCLNGLITFKNLSTPSFFQYKVSGVISGPVFVYIFTLVFLKAAMLDTFEQLTNVVV